MGRASVNRIVQIAPETTAGVPAVSGYKNLPTLSMDIGPVIAAKQYRAQGNNYNGASRIHKQYGQGRFTGPISYQEIVYPLSSICGAATITTPGGGTNSRQWLFNPAPRGADAFKTFTVLQGDSTAAEQLVYSLFTDLTFSFGLDDSQMSGTMLGRNPVTSALGTNEVQSVSTTGTPTGGTFTLTFSGQTTAAIAYNASAATIQAALEALSNIGTGNVAASGGPLPSAVSVGFVGALAGTDVAAMTHTDSLTGGTSPAVAISTSTAGSTTSSATDLALLPISAREVDVFMDSTFAGIGTTKLVNAYNANLSVGNKYNARWVLNTSYQSFVDVVSVPPSLSFSFQMEHDSQSRALFSGLSSNPTKFFRIQSTGPIIEGAIPYLIQVDVAANVSAVSQEDVDGDWARTYTASPISAASMGRPFSVKVVNDILAL